MRQPPPGQFPVEQRSAERESLRPKAPVAG